MGITLDSIKSKMIGHTFGQLTVEEYAGRSDRGDNLWKCVCSCGAEVIGRTASVDKDTSACKQCKFNRTPHAEKHRTYLLNTVHGNLTVIAYDGKNKYGSVKWKCVCACGNQISAFSNELISGARKSCGCLAREKASLSNIKHGLIKHPLYAVWAAMKDRCFNENHPSYHRYGGRGINVCESWTSNFMMFYNWALRSGYFPGLTLERTDNDGNYEPGNCRWATQQEQMQNRNMVKLTPDSVLEIYSDPQSHSKIAEKYNIAESSVSRIKGGKTWTNVTRHNDLKDIVSKITIDPIPNNENILC